jgi:hypothetical protein
MADNFRDLSNEVDELSSEDYAKLYDVVKRIKIAIHKTFGKQHGYLKQLDNITFTPSKYELTSREHFRELSIQETKKINPQELKKSIERDCLKANEQFPMELKEKSPQEFQEYMLKEIEEYYRLEESRSRESSWSSVTKGLSRFLEMLSIHAWYTNLNREQIS